MSESRQQDDQELLALLSSDIDITKPSMARAYDYLLGGKNNFEVDRQVADRIIRDFPGVVALGKHNRAFIRRVIPYLVGECGITQLLDIGSGLPTAGNVHEIAHEVNPETRVVYVDIDPLVLTHARALLAEDTERVGVIVADARNPASIFDDPTTQKYIDFDKPLGLIMTLLLHNIKDEDDPVGITRVIKDRLPSGSYMALCNLIDDGESGHKEAERTVLENMGTGFFRTWEQHREYFEGLEFVEPGLVYVNDWRPDEDTVKDSAWHTFLAAGVARKP